MYGFSEAYDEGLEQGKEDKENELTTRAVEKCSFCNKPREEIRKLILGCGVSICDECVELCEQILREELYSKREEDE